MLCTFSEFQRQILDHPLLCGIEYCSRAKMEEPGDGGSSLLVCTGMGGMGGARGAAVSGSTRVMGGFLGHTWVQCLG